MRTNKTLEPGSPVWVQDSTGQRGAVGTIGAFLFHPGDPHDSVWLLSSAHVLAPERCDMIDPVVMGMDSIVISHKVKAIPLKPHGNTADAALAELLRDVRAPSLAGSKLISPKPIAPAAGSLVQKTGTGTGLTEGMLLRRLSNIEVLLEGSEIGWTEFVDQMCIASLPGRPRFLDFGDSGSLVVCHGQPAGLLVGMMEERERNGSPFAIATPIETVLNTIEKLMGHRLEIIVEGKM